MYQAQKDVLEYLILSKYGGVYFDSDVQCLINMEEIVHKYKFFAAIEPPSRWTKIPVVMIGVVGSSPNNKIITDALEIAASSYKKYIQRKTIALEKE